MRGVIWQHSELKDRFRLKNLRNNDIYRLSMSVGPVVIEFEGIYDYAQSLESVLNDFFSFWG